MQPSRLSVASHSIKAGYEGDGLGRPIQTQQPANTGSSTPAVTQFGYDAMDSLTSVADPHNLSVIDVIGV